MRSRKPLEHNDDNDMSSSPLIGKNLKHDGRRNVEEEEGEKRYELEEPVSNEDSEIDVTTKIVYTTAVCMYGVTAREVTLSFGKIMDYVKTVYNAASKAAAAFYRMSAYLFDLIRNPIGNVLEILSRGVDEVMKKLIFVGPFFLRTLQEAVGIRIIARSVLGETALGKTSGRIASWTYQSVTHLVPDSVKNVVWGATMGLVTGNPLALASVTPTMMSELCSLPDLMAAFGQKLSVLNAVNHLAEIIVDAKAEIMDKRIMTECFDRPSVTNTGCLSLGKLLYKYAKQLSGNWIAVTTILVMIEQMTGVFSATLRAFAKALRKERPPPPLAPATTIPITTPFPRPDASFGDLDHEDIDESEMPMDEMLAVLSGENGSVVVMDDLFVELLKGMKEMRVPEDKVVGLGFGKDTDLGSVWWNAMSPIDRIALFTSLSSNDRYSRDVGSVVEDFEPYEEEIENTNRLYTEFVAKIQTLGNSRESIKPVFDSLCERGDQGPLVDNFERFRLMMPPETFALYSSGKAGFNGEAYGKSFDRMWKNYKERSSDVSDRRLESLESLVSIVPSHGFSMDRRDLARRSLSRFGSDNLSPQQRTVIRTVSHLNEGIAYGAVEILKLAQIAVNATKHKMYSSPRMRFERKGVQKKRSVSKNGAGRGRRSRSSSYGKRKKP